MANRVNSLEYAVKNFVNVDKKCVSIRRPLYRKPTYIINDVRTHTIRMSFQRIRDVVGYVVAVRKNCDADYDRVLEVFRKIDSCRDMLCFMQYVKDVVDMFCVRAKSIKVKGTKGEDREFIEIAGSRV